jgi:hypothetical protein
MINGAVPVAPLDGDANQHTVPTTWNGEEFEVVLETASTDTWLISPDFTCVSAETLEPTEQMACEFRKAYSRLFGNNTLGFLLRYVDANAVRGDIGVINTMGVAGINVNKQIVGLAKRAQWLGNGVASGRSK